MLDDAFRQIAGLVSQAVGGPYAAGVLKYQGEPVYDDGGSIVSPGEPYDVPCRVQVDRVTEAMRLAEGFQERDVRLLIIDPVALTTEPDVTVTGGQFAGQTYSLMSVDRDTLGFGWECRARGS